MRRTIAATDNPAVLGAAAHRNNGRYNGDGRTWATPPEVFQPLEEAGALVVGLLPASTDLRWWHEDIEPGRRRGDVDVRFLRGRVRFLTDGPYRASGFFGSAIVVWGDGR